MLLLPAAPRVERLRLVSLHVLQLAAEVVGRRGVRVPVGARARGGVTVLRTCVTLNRKYCLSPQSQSAIL